MGWPRRAGRVRHIDLDLVFPHSLDCRDGGPRCPHEGSRIFWSEQKGKCHPPFLGDHEIANHSRREEVVLQPRIPNPRQGSRDLRLERLVQELHRLNVLDFRNHLTQSGLDSLLEGHGRGRAAMTGAPQTQEENALLLVEIHHLDMPPVGGDVRAKGVKSAFYTINGVHVPPAGRIPTPSFGI